MSLQSGPSNSRMCDRGTISSTRKTCVKSSNAILIFSIALLASVYITSLFFPLFSDALYCSHPDINFGVVESGDVGIGTYRLWNVHPWPINLHYLATSCDCTAAISDQKLPARLRPFSSINVVVNVNTVGKRGFERQAISAVGSHSSLCNLYIQGTIVRR